MLAEFGARLLTKRPKPNVQIPQKPNSAAHGVREILNVYDYDSATKARLIWQASLPLDVLQEHLPDTCRYNHDVGRLRLQWAIIGALLGFALMAGAWYTLYVVVLHAPLQLVMKNIVLMGVLLGPGPATLLGWWYGIRFRAIEWLSLPPGIWMVRRVTFTDGDKDSDLQKGEDDPENVLTFTGTPASWRAVRALPYTALKDIADDDFGLAEVSTQSLELLGAKQVVSNSHNGATVIAPYRPTVHRATVLFEDLKQRVVRERRGRKAPSGWHKLQIGATIGLALAIVGLMIFAALVLEKKGKTEAPAPAVSEAPSIRIWGDI